MSNLIHNIKSISTWQRLFFVLLYLVVACIIVEAVFVTVVVLQCGFLLLSGKKNDNLLQFANSVLRYYVQVLEYLSFKSDDRPFPFKPWP